MKPATQYCIPQGERYIIPNKVEVIVQVTENRNKDVVIFETSTRGLVNHGGVISRSVVTISNNYCLRT